MIPLYIFPAGEPASAAQVKTLAALDAELRAHGSALVVRHGSPAQVLRIFAQAVGAYGGLYFSRAEGAEARARDAKVKAELGSMSPQPMPVYEVEADASAPPLDAIDGRFHPLDGILNYGLTPFQEH